LSGIRARAILDFSRISPLERLDRIGAASSEVLAMSNTTLYDRDFYAWANEQAALLRAGNLTAADIEHIAEEIESMGRGEQQQLENRLTVLLLHFLKWQFQPNLRGNSWRLAIKEQRARIARHLRKNPSLQSVLNETIADAYSDALIGAERETGLAETVFPSACPWTFEQIVDHDFWPEGGPH
jgi:hypothetical protein